MIGSDTLKAGGLYEFNRKILTSYGTNYMGAFNFGSSTSNSLATNDGYANALLGLYQTYKQSSNHLSGPEPL